MYSSDLTDLSIEPAAIRRLTPEQKDRLTDLLDRYLSALENGLPPRREELFEEHPDLAEPLGAYLDSLEELHDVAAGFGGPSGGPPAAAQDPQSSEKELGDYRLLREIGRGGMGVVYEARQISLGRRVALKVLPFAAVLDSKQIARFKNEAQAAAQLDHPNIVSVYAVGAERGVHYYAMRFIDGQPLDRAIAELRRASGGSTVDLDEAEDTIDAVGESNDAETEDVCPSTCGSFLTAKSTDGPEFFHAAAQLGIQAADALHAAHEYGIVHRDVKPSNLLLDGDGKLWVTDFGLARCQSDVALTRTGDVVGTMRYMSPEQAAGQTALVDQRTDVYSLGLTLYELLALRPAFPGEDGPVLLRRIDEQEPRHLGKLDPRIPSDLATVVHKAMAKQREERYTTAREFAEDLQRVLEGKPTVARPPTVADRFGKWVRRHQRIVTAVSVVCICAVLGLATSTMIIAREKNKAEQNYQRSEEYFREAKKAVDDFYASAAEKLADVPGASQVRKGLLEEALRYYHGFVEKAKHDPSLRADLALTYGKIATLTEAIGSTEEAIEAHRIALRLFQQLVDENPNVADYRRSLALCHNNLGLALARSGRTDEARRAYLDAIRLQSDFEAGSEDAGQSLSDLALSHSNLGQLLSETGEANAAEQSFREAIQLQEELLEVEPDNPEYLRNIAASFNNLSALYVDDAPDRAAELYQKALRYQTEAADGRSGELKHKSDVARTYNNLGAVQSRMERLHEAAASYGRAIDIQRQLVRADPADKSYCCDLAVSFNNLGLTQSKLRMAWEAEASFKQALLMQNVLVRQNPYDVDLQSSLGGMHNNLGIILEQLGRVEDAAQSYKKAVEHQRVAYLHAPKVSRYRVFLSKHYYNRGRVLRQLAHPDEAIRAALDRKELWPDDPERLLTVAREFAWAAKLCTESTHGDPTLDQCAGYAAETLRQAVASGLELPDDLYRDESFAALKDHHLLAEFIKK